MYTSSGVGGYTFIKDYLKEALSPAKMNFKSRVQKKGSRYYASLEKEEKRIRGTFAVGYRKKVLANIPVEVRIKKEQTTTDKKVIQKIFQQQQYKKCIYIKNSHQLDKSPLLKSGNGSNFNLYKECHNTKRKCRYYTPSKNIKTANSNYRKGYIFPPNFYCNEFLYISGFQKSY